MNFSLRSVLAFAMSFACSLQVCLSQPMQLDIKNYKVSIESPYRLDPKKDLAVGIGSAALIVTGFVIKSFKTPVDSARLAVPDVSHIPAIDIGAIHQYDHTYLTASDVLEYTAVAMPFISFVDKRVSGHGKQVILLYLETLALNAGIYNMTTAIVNRQRPLTFNTDTLANGDPEVPLSAKHAKNVKESFFSGHTSNAACATFFGARIFTDFRPHSALVPFVWGAAAAVPAFVGFSRYKAGKHFPTDVITGYVIGASIGYFMPVLHRIKNSDRVSLYPLENGLGMVYTF